MKIKTKLIASIMSICLVCAVFAIGVFALKTANLKIGGDVSFSATGVEADIKNVTLTGATTNDQVLATGSINTSMTQAEIDSKFQNWQTLELDFDENATDIELKFDIANTSTNADNYIEIDYSYSFSNSSPNVDVFPGDENDEKVWQNNNYILTPKGSAATATYETFTLKFKVLDKELNVPQDTKVTINIALKHHTAQSATATNNVVTIDNIQYTLHSPSAGFATVTGCTTETSALIHPVVKSNGEGAIPCVVTKIGDAAFEACEFTSITIPSSVTIIGDYAFGDSFLTSISLPNSVTSIESEAFWCCESLSSINLPNSLTSIGSSAFGECGAFSSITIPSSVTSMGSNAFSNCTGLTTITIPSGVTSIGSFAFSGCSSLTTITIPSSVISIGANAFVNTAWYNTWYNNQPNGLIYINYVLYKYKGTMPEGTRIEVKEGTVSISGSAFSGCTGLTSITIPSSVTSIGGSAFDGCTGLTSITIPNGVTSIGSSAFRGCTGLTAITIPNGVTSIGGSAFSGCTGLTSITIPSSVTRIGGGAFRGCSRLTTITIPSSVTSIGLYAFSGCENLNSVKFETPNGWFATDEFEDETEAVEISTTDFAANAILLTDTYCDYNWHRDA